MADDSLRQLAVGDGTVLLAPETDDDWSDIRHLLQEYAHGLGVDLCFQDFDHELARLPGVYAAPRGAMRLVRVDGEAAGCCALRPLDAVDYANAFAPEHLELQCANARGLAARCTTSGAIFVGKYSSEAAGDYLAGGNHVLPTGGAARYASPLGVADFRKQTSIIEYSEEAAAAHAGPIATLAAAEGLEGHGRSALMRGRRE